MPMGAAHLQRSRVGADVGLLALPILLEHGGKSAGIRAGHAETGHCALGVLPSDSLLTGRIAGCILGGAMLQLVCRMYQRR
jgi:hypothetical protein